MLQPNEETPDGQYNLNPMEWMSAGPELCSYTELSALQCKFQVCAEQVCTFSKRALSSVRLYKFTGWQLCLPTEDLWWT